MDKIKITEICDKTDTTPMTDDVKEIFDLYINRFKEYLAKLKDK
jgi:hypothetical protein